MPAIWRNEGDGWRVVSPLGFADEAALHSLIADAPELLPLAGSPQLVVLGREVQLGYGYADLVAVETSGRPVIIEVKLARNPEARRAVVAQVLTYASYLRGNTIADLERGCLASSLQERDANSIAGLVQSHDQAGAFQADEFESALAQSLESGAFRLVVVLDQAPPELARLVAYLESVTAGLLIDLISVSAYSIAGSEILIPQRVEGELEPPGEQKPSASGQQGELTDGGGAFAEVIAAKSPPVREKAARLLTWAQELERDGLAHLHTYCGPSQTALLVYVPGEQAGLVTAWASGGLSVWRTVFLRRAPSMVTAVEHAITPARLGQGSGVTATDEVLAAIRAAYVEAAG